ncbi:hypothetical protein PtrSN002B_005933 [Pyrenophora tritici-repentis]|uniref:Uncharacterized protein n=1 Tax=Pyrenophora tritici-repentis TaxID=45151 RepID=A0A2W1GEV0_9PLEO|nr:hypothetical protein PtrV1_13558 [Pyrenophora tritici-repentis]KAF7447418.1 hypothetical protein A1F99_088650 [Pyrenophora tritici-repentis]KAF7569784.1 hypothetical protein PtrM4_121990 [Pyrenophora tritici-repentis]KAG9382493.1 hypothetical protein A1F94_006414 [Pyrenophora tritici-repentis]KAI0581938.1 hypothetical protein Alg215_04392 [Pyrenophora tritici-repentis]
MAELTVPDHLQAYLDYVCQAYEATLIESPKYRNMAEQTVPERLQALLTIVREANQIESDRIPLEAFLASLQHKPAETGERSSEDSQVIVNETHLSVRNNSLVPHRTQTSPEAVSRAVQTDSATISLWDAVVPQARTEGYGRGFHEGIDVGYKSGFEEGKSLNMSEALSMGFERGKIEGFKMAQEQHKALEQERNVELAKELADEARVLEAQRAVGQAAEDMDQDCVSKYCVDDKAAGMDNKAAGVDNKVSSKGVTVEKSRAISTTFVGGRATSNGMMPKQSPTVSRAFVDDKVACNGMSWKEARIVSAAVTSKEKKAQATSNGADPFAVLLPLMRNK